MSLRQQNCLQISYLTRKAAATRRVRHKPPSQTTAVFATFFKQQKPLKDVKASVLVHYTPSLVLHHFLSQVETSIHTV